MLEPILGTTAGAFILAAVWTATSMTTSGKFCVTGVLLACVAFFAWLAEN